MAQPRSNHSTARRNKRRSHHALKAPNLIQCPNCAKPALPHRVCPACGFYKGRQVVQTSEE